MTSFTIKINGVRTEANDVISQVEFTVKGEDQGCYFELPQTLNLGAPGEDFIAFANLQPSDVERFIENDFKNMAAVKAHIQYVLDNEIATSKATSKPLPWLPVEPNPAPVPQP